MENYQGDLFDDDRTWDEPPGLADEEFEDLPFDETDPELLVGLDDTPTLGPTNEQGVPLSLMEGLNPAQLEAAQTLRGPLLVVAGPGSGKTRVLTNRIAALLSTGVRPWEILAVTFTNKAAAEMRERIGRLVGESVASDMWVATFHSACVRILRTHHAAAGLPRSFSICDTSDSQKVLRNLLNEMNAPAEASAIKELASSISWAKNAGLSHVDLFMSDRATDRATAPYMQAYNERLQLMGAVDFDDILLRTLNLLEGNAEVASRYQNKFKHVSIDEVQDTNAVQVRLIRALVPSAIFSPEAPLGINRSLCLVGDLDQSIYGFRGASSDAVTSFAQDYPSAKVVVLEQNYRSTKAIIEVVQAIIDPNPALHRPRLFTQNDAGEPVRLYVAEDDKDEAAWVISEIRKTRAPLDEHAVLVRTNAQTRSFEEELARNAMAYQVVGALRFYDRAEVKDALSYLRVAVNPRDEVNLARCINTPRRGIGDATVGQLLQLARDTGVDPIAALRAGLKSNTLPKRAVRSLGDFLTIYDQVVTACATSPSRALEVVSDVAGLREALKADKSSAIDRVENLEELVGSAKEFVMHPSSTRPDRAVLSTLPGWEQTEAFLENVALVSSADVGDEDLQVRKVSLLTTHSSKGKEFPHVFVVGVEDTLYPHERSKGDEVAEQEERRLLFVAASRAEKTLTLSRCKGRYMFNRFKNNSPSPFLDDLPESVRVIRSSRRSSVSAPYPSQRPSYSAGRGGGFGRSTSGASKTPTSGTTTKVAPLKIKGPRLTVDQLAVGTSVHHTVFGTGTVQELEGSKATVVFEKATKVLDLTFAPLTLG